MNPRMCVHACVRVCVCVRARCVRVVLWMCTGVCVRVRVWRVQGPADFGRATVSRARAVSPTVSGLASTLRTTGKEFGLEPKFSPMALATSGGMRSLLSKSQTLRSRLSSTAPSLGKTGEL